jgi:hypothetical protein
MNDEKSTRAIALQPDPKTTSFGFFSGSDAAYTDPERKKKIVCQFT